MDKISLDEVRGAPLSSPRPERKQKSLYRLFCCCCSTDSVEISPNPLRDRVCEVKSERRTHRLGNTPKSISHSLESFSNPPEFENNKKVVSKLLREIGKSPYFTYSDIRIASEILDDRYAKDPIGCVIGWLKQSEEANGRYASRYAPLSDGGEVVSYIICYTPGIERVDEYFRKNLTRSQQKDLAEMGFWVRLAQVKNKRKVEENPKRTELYKLLREFSPWLSQRFVLS